MGVKEKPERGWVAFPTLFSSSLLPLPSRRQTCVKRSGLIVSGEVQATARPLSRSGAPRKTDAFQSSTCATVPPTARMHTMRTQGFALLHADLLLKRHQVS